MRRHPGSKVDNAATRLVVEHRYLGSLMVGFGARRGKCSCGWVTSGTWSTALLAKEEWARDHAPEGSFA